MKKITLLKNSNKTEDKLLYVMLKYNISNSTSSSIHRFVMDTGWVSFGYRKKIEQDDVLNYPYTWIQYALQRLRKRKIVQCYGQRWYINKEIFTCKLKKI